MTCEAPSKRASGPGRPRGTWAWAATAAAAALWTFVSTSGRVDLSLFAAGLIVVIALLAAKLAPPTTTPSGVAAQPSDAIVAAVPDALVCFAAEGTIVYTNAAARHLLFDGQTTNGRNFLGMVANAPEALREAFTVESDRLFTIETGGWRETYQAVRRPLDIGGKPHVLLMVRRMTRPLSRHDVERSRQLIRLINHEVNNSLAPIVSLTRSAKLAMQLPAAEARVGTALETISERARHLLDFVGGYASMARLPPPQARTTDWGPVLDQLRSLFPHASICSAPARQGWFDATQIEQVLLNLMKNANEAGGDEREVELVVTLLDDGSSELEVLDRGSGLSQEARAHAFTPLFTTKEGGSGMGLTLCREIVEGHGGTIGLSGREGGGTRLRVVLPARGAIDDSLSRSTLSLSRA